MSKHILIRVFTFPTLVALLVLSFAVFGARDGVRADDVPTGATVGGSGGNPIIECAWILPDATTTASPDTMQYGNDDNTAVPGPPPPCDSNGTQPATQATVVGPPTAAQIHVHINPNPENQPNTQLIELWGAIDPPSGTASAWLGGAFWKVYHPDGSLKVQVESTKILPIGGGGCGQASGTSPALAEMLDFADTNTGNGNGTGQMSQNARASIEAICQQNGKALYKGTFELHKEQACGNYKVEFWATGGATNQILTYWFNVPCVQHLRIDFTSVAWGNLVPGTPGQVLGDIVWSTPACIAGPISTGTCPTVKNVGNAGMGFSVTNSVMTECSGPSGPCAPLAGAKEIIDFDACFGRSPSTIQCLDPAPASGSCSALTDAASVAAGEDPNCRNRQFVFDTDRERTLCANELGKLDLSVHPQSGLPSGRYEGSITVIGTPQSVLHCGENTGASSAGGGG